MKKNVFKEFEALSDFWSPIAVAEANGQLVKLAKIKGEFDWHHHADEDEMTIQYRDRENVILSKGDIHSVPKGAEHCPACEEECWVVLFEPAVTAHTGNVVTEKTKTIEEQVAQMNS